jgi:DNA-binding response OmpR family regulator
MPNCIDKHRNVIVVADDDEDILDLISVSLERRGNTVLTAHDGEEALSLVIDRQPDLVLLDVAMPNLTGYEVMHRVRAVLAEIPVILVSAYATEDAIAEGWKEGADDYIVKPFRPDDLARRAAALLAGPPRGPVLRLGQAPAFSRAARTVNPAV